MGRTPFICAVIFAVVSALSIAGAQLRPLVKGGRDARDGELPFQVGLISSNPPYADCSGVILREEWVLTAFHCVMDRAVTVKGGSTSLKDTKHPARNVVEVRRHPNFAIDSKSSPPNRRYFNDLALLRVDKPFQFDNVYLASIRLPDNADHEAALINGSPNFVAGWGFKQLEQFVLNLQVAQVTPVNLNLCRAAYPEAEVRGNNLCSGDSNQNHCSGDSGGPYVAKLGRDARLLGIISWGDLCGMDRPGVHSRALAFKEWIYNCMDGRCDDPRNARVSR